jgi:alcohol dehydrogenase
VRATTAVITQQIKEEYANLCRKILFFSILCTKLNLFFENLNINSFREKHNEFFQKWQNGIIAEKIVDSNTGRLWIMRELLKKTRALIYEYTRGNYLFESNCTDKTGEILASFGEGRKICLIMGGTGQEWSSKLLEKIKISLAVAGLNIHVGAIKGASPNAPLEDVFRIASVIEEEKPNLILTVGGGSSVDTAKFASLFAAIRKKYPNPAACEGSGKINNIFAEFAIKKTPVVAFQTSLSPSHITRFANLFSSHENRILHLDDPLLVPNKAIFDSRWTMSLPAKRVTEGALEAFSHCLETYITYDGQYLEYIENLSLCGLELVMRNAVKALDENNIDAREAIAAASDAGGICLMTAMPNGGHLGSPYLPPNFNHTLICAVLNPYYLVFYSSAIENKIAKIAEVLKRCGFLSLDANELSLEGLAEAVSDAICDFYKKLNIPSSLSKIESFDENTAAVLREYAKKALVAAGFEQIPVHLDLLNVSKYLRLVYEAAFTGDKTLIMKP